VSLLIYVLRMYTLHTAHRLWEWLQAMEQQLQVQELEFAIGDVPELNFKELATASAVQQQHAHVHKVSIMGIAVHAGLTC
jgi:hypothetical protein